MRNLGTFWNELSTSRRWVLTLGGCLIIVLTIALAWWSARPRYQVLFSNLRPADAAEITTTLDGWHTPHQFADNATTVLVPADVVYETRMKLVAQGVPHGGSVGFEDFKDSDFGVTEFAQHVNYQRALQGELERTIASLSEVQSARVHLTMQRETLFESQQAPAKASVTLTLRHGKSLAPQQVAGIQRLLASAVKGLVPDQVVVLDDGGNVLSGPTSVLGLTRGARAHMQTDLRQRVAGILRNVLGAHARFSVSVDVQLNYDHIKRVRDQLLPQGKNGNGLLTRRTSSGHRRADGKDQTTPDTQKGDYQTDVQFAHSRQQEEIEVAPGGIERVSVGIVVPRGVDAKTIASLHGVIAAAVGLDTSRGDQLSIASLGAVAVKPTPSTTSVPRPPLEAASATAAIASATSSASLVRIGNVALSVWQLAAGIGAIILMAFGLGLLLSRRRGQRLDPDERAALLRDVRQWVADGDAA